MKEVQRNKDTKEQREADKGGEKARERDWWEEERKIEYSFMSVKNAAYPNLLSSPVLPPPLTDSGEAGNNADYHNCLKCVWIFMIPPILL